MWLPSQQASSCGTARAPVVCSVIHTRSSPFRGDGAPSANRDLCGNHKELTKACFAFLLHALACSHPHRRQLTPLRSSSSFRSLYWMDLLHLGRRGSASAAPGVTASGSGSGAGANNDDRHPYPTPSTSASFTSPEGSYELAYEVSPPVPATPATPGLAGAGSNPAAALAALNANPEHIPSLCVVSIRIPAAGSGGSGSGSGLLGLGGSQRGRAREASVSSTGGAAAGGLGAGITGQQYAGGFNASHDDQASSSNSASSYGGEASNSYPSNLPSLSPGPPSKRKALVSLPSMPSLPSVGLPGLGGGGANHGANAASNVTHKEQNAPTSKPKSAFRGTSSTFVKGYEGLPLSSRADKLWQSAEPRDVTLAVSTVGKSVLITDISPRAKSRVRRRAQSIRLVTPARAD